jgi:hypothetical protein
MKYLQFVLQKDILHAETKQDDIFIINNSEISVGKGMQIKEITNH